MALLIGVAAILAGALLLTSAPAPPYSVHDKAYYASEATLNFVRPGLVIKVLGAEISADGTARVRVRFTDPRGVPLEREGNTTPGPITCSIVLAYLPKDGTQYVSYTTRRQTSPITGQSATQAGADQGGVWAKVADGEYTYTLTTKVPANADRTLTHTVGAYGSRNLSEFDLPNSYDDDAFNFVPAGGAVAKVRDVIKTATCNQCHGQLAFHGGSRRTMEVCVLCHTPQTTDPDTGNTVDMPVMTHRIHMGANLPSVRGGKPYVIIGNQQSVHDYSKIRFVADARNCRACHEQTTGAAQARNYYNASRAACGACHDDVNFATGENHIPIPQGNDAQCARCHIPKGDIDFDASVDGAHVIPRFSESLPGVKFTILDVKDTAPGQQPLVTFVIEDKKGNPILANQMTRLTLILAGPNSDYSTYYSETALTADGNGFGVSWWRFNNRIPADAKGSWTIALEGRREIKLLPGTAKEVTARDTGINVQKYFSVDNSPVVERRKAVSMVKCNQCHEALAFHGEARNTVEECVICHNPTMTDRSTPARSIELGTMIHKIHRGRELERGYSIASDSYNEVGFPGDLRNCSTCHINNAELLPMTGDRLNVRNPFEPISPLGRETAVCLGCHDGKAAVAHAATNTHPTLGESCSACHGRDGAYSVTKVHAR